MVKHANFFLFSMTGCKWALGRNVQQNAQLWRALTLYFLHRRSIEQIFDKHSLHEQASQLCNIQQLPDQEQKARIKLQGLNNEQTRVKFCDWLGHRRLDLESHFSHGEVTTVMHLRFWLPTRPITWTESSVHLLLCKTKSQFIWRLEFRSILGNFGF